MTVPSSSPLALSLETRAARLLKVAPPLPVRCLANPGIGQLGSLARRTFSGPIFRNIDAALQKRTNITERQYIDFRAEAFNLTNTVSFNVNDYNINNTNFGRITNTQSGRRVVQLSLYYRF